MADAATMTIKAVLLPDEIQTTLKDLTFSYTPADVSEKWFYKLINVPHTGGGVDLISGKFLTNSAGIAIASDNEDIATTDKIRFLFIKNTGTTDGDASNTTDERVHLVLDGSDVAHGSTNAIEISSGESWYGKIPNTTVDDLHAISADPDQTAGGGNVQCIVAAVIHDVSV